MENSAELLKKHYQKIPPYNNKCIKDKCKEKGCHLKGVTSKSFLILDGDEIEKCNTDSNKSSVDCILIKNENKENDVILFVELKNGSYSLNKLVEKFENSYNEIRNVFKNKDSEHPTPKFLYIGRFNTPHERKKANKTVIKSYPHNNVNFRTISRKTCHIEEMI